MSKIDEIKEYIGALKNYLSIMVAIAIGIGAGVAKLYIDNNISILFYTGVLIIALITVGFCVIAKHLHKTIKKLGDL